MKYSEGHTTKREIKSISTINSEKINFNIPKSIEEANKKMTYKEYKKLYHPNYKKKSHLKHSINSNSSISKVYISIPNKSPKARNKNNVDSLLK